MLYALSFFGLIFIFLFFRGFIVGSRRREETHDAACADYMAFKADLKTWLSDRENPELKSKAATAVRAINQSLQAVKLTRTSDIKTAKQAALYEYAKAITNFYNVDVEYDLTSADIGDPVFRNAIEMYSRQVRADASATSTNPVTIAGRTENDKSPIACPQCNHSPIAEILYGFPNFEDESLKKDVDEGRVTLGGCIVSGGQAKWKCLNCGLVIFPDQTPIKD